MRALIGALAICTVALPAMAQQPAATQQTPSQQAAPVPASGQWRASKVIGVDVYNQQNEKLGEIEELIIDQSGRVAGAVVGVGGFLGIGEHDIMVPMERLRFSNEAGKSTTGAAGADNRQWYPDRAVMNATKEQLRETKSFKY
jgi:sporulation protein YlmC with PRC-barrel domain